MSLPTFIRPSKHLRRPSGGREVGFQWHFVVLALGNTGATITTVFNTTVLRSYFHTFTLQRVKKWNVQASNLKHSGRIKMFSCRGSSAVLYISTEK